MKKIFLTSSLLALAFAPFIAYGEWMLPYNYGLPSQTVYGIVQNILLWLLSILGIVGIIGFAISGIMYLLSAGDDNMIDRAKKGMTYSILGIIVGLAGFIIIQAVERMLNGYNRF